MGAEFNINVGMIRAFAFGLLTLSVFIANGFTKTILNTLTDPFWVGAFVMCISWIICLMNNKSYISVGDNKINIPHAAMTFFIITKVIAHTEHGGHYGPWGATKGSH